MTRALIADDHIGFRQSVKRFLASTPGIEVIGEASDGEEAILKARALQPDIVLMDIQMPGTSGLEALRRIRQESPAIKVIMLTIFDERVYREEAQSRGAHGYVVKSSMAKALIPEIQRVMRLADTSEE
ncbi:MAG: response regulator transcription factor [Chloroflexi bacterium]|nr:response regulator transcription factor [Chloroflexota bacterium]